MKFLSVRDLRNNSAQVWKDLPGEGAMVVTNNGHPVAILVPVTEDDLEQSLADWRRIRAAAALRHIQRESVRKGTDRMTMEEIDEEIALARREREARIKPRKRAAPPTPEKRQHSPDGRSRRP